VGDVVVRAIPVRKAGVNQRHEQALKESKHPVQSTQPGRKRKRADVWARPTCEVTFDDDSSHEVEREGGQKVGTSRMKKKLLSRQHVPSLAGWLGSERPHARLSLCGALTDGLTHSQAAKLRPAAHLSQTDRGGRSGFGEI
jgi:hypothetical protein